MSSRNTNKRSVFFQLCQKPIEAVVKTENARKGLPKSYNLKSTEFGAKINMKKSKILKNKNIIIILHSVLARTPSKLEYEGFSSSSSDLRLG